MQYCQACGYSNSVGVYACSRCGASLASAPMVTTGGYYAAQPQKSSAAKALLITGGILLVLIVVVIGGLYIIGSRIEKQRAEAAALRQTQITAMTIVQAREKELNDDLKRDIDASKPTTDADLNAMADRINAYVAAARQIDTTGCPPAFTEAYDRYMSTWTEEAHTFREHPHVPTDGEVVVDQIASIFDDNAPDSTKQFQQQFQTWLNDLKAKDAETDKRSAELKSIVTNY